MTGVLVHEWIAQSGGSENVLEVMSRIYPDSDVVCLWNDSTGRFDPARVRESWLARTPLRKSKALALPFMPLTWAHRENHDYEWALISSHLFAHHARFGADIPRFVYVHSPARYIWTPELDRRGASLPVRALGSIFKPIDRKKAAETDRFAANSEFVRERIASTWERPSRVIYPPVEVSAIQDVDEWRTRLDGDETKIVEELPAQFVLGASRFIPYKRLDLVIRAGEVSNLPVVLAGNGPELAALRAAADAASVPVHFVLSPSSPLLYALYQAASVYVFPAIEDFGIMPVEAMAAGAPVVANRVGGAAESVIPGLTGALTEFESDAELAAAVESALATTRENRRERARAFSRERFETEIREWVGA